MRVPSVMMKLKVKWHQLQWLGNYKGNLKRREQKEQKLPMYKSKVPIFIAMQQLHTCLWGVKSFVTLKQVFGQSNEGTRNDTGVEIDADSFYEAILKCNREVDSWLSMLSKIKIKQQANPPGRVNTTNIVPICSKSLANRQPTKKALGLMEFLSSILYSVFNIYPHYHCALLIFGPSLIRYRAEILSTEIVSKLGNSNKATHFLLSLGEAFTEFFPQIIDMMMIMLCYLLILWLVCPLHPVLQIFIVLMLITAPCYYIPELVSMASGVGVTCGLFKLPLIWFNALGALALSLIFVFLTLLLIYLIQRYIHPGGPRVKELHVGLDALSEILTDLNE
ncbi:hypothetical protein VNO78_15135 [Psophocarpus tetragonolobus]|uniref:Uncharacterized protein n=1 Tax=Psophocarpus tetragonolobus TaxID=3891 RepID=A0AAN9XJM2_PSOTE